LFDDIRAEAGTLVYPEDPVYTPNHAADYAAYNRPDRASRSFTLSCTPLDSTGDALRLTHNWKKHRSQNSSGADKTADHGNSFVLGDQVRRQAVRGAKVPECCRWALSYFKFKLYRRN